MTQVEPATAEIVEAEPVRALPARRKPGTIAVLGREVPVATAATAGAVAGVAVIAVRRASRPRRRVPRRGLFRRRERIVARRSFLVDVHVLGR